VGLRRSGQIVAIDPNTDQVAGAAIPLGDVSALAAAGGALWAVSTAEDALARIDTSALRVADTIAVCDNPVALAVADDGVWVACSIARRLWHVSEAGERVAEYALDGLPTSIAVVRDRVWVTLRGD
jgi:streptogramin lyase